MPNYKLCRALNENLKRVQWLETLGLCLTEWHKSEKNKRCTLTHIRGIKKRYTWTYVQGRDRDTDVENGCIDMGGSGKGRVGWNERLGLPWIHCACVLSHLVVSNSLRPHRLQPAGLLCPWHPPGENAGVGCHFLLQGLLLTQGSDQIQVSCISCTGRQVLYH